ncbi:DNA methyltransferase [Arthrospira platensis BEA 1257B]
MSLFPESVSTTKVADLMAPKTYTGLAGFHKYWGKKPIESISYLIENCTQEGDIVMDPFLGSGLISRECLLRNRHFIGIDINPFSIEHTSLMLNLPDRQEYYQALIEIETKVAQNIHNTYRTTAGKIASHYLWEGDRIVSVWCKPETGRGRIEIDPSDIDFQSYSAYQHYQPKNFRHLHFFTNSRINVKPTMSVSDIFTGRDYAKY